MYTLGFMEEISATPQLYNLQDSALSFTNMKLSGDKRILYGYNKAQKNQL